MELLYKAKYVTLKCHHGKFLHANSDEKTVFQHRDGSCKSAKWRIEFDEGMDNVIRLKIAMSRVDGSKSKSEGRLVYYYVADEKGNVNDTLEEPSFQFKEQGLKELTQKLEEETGLNNVTLCLRNKLDGKLYPLRLELPPNNATMHLIILPAPSKG
ncbi:hypothetical protein RDI58_007391 [Solanum bulbocastanum]|uniref:Uncharacterized protein n=1 Tax=Solanum bulbocastanum TaxID=147425 RepID=A0AAN8TSR1_SOLBU